MASRIYSADQPGNRYHFTTRILRGAMVLTIGRTREDMLLSFALDNLSLRRIRMSFQPLCIGERASLRYTVVTQEGLAQMGYLFEFQDGLAWRSVFIRMDAMEWLTGNPDGEELQPRTALSPWERSLLPC